MSTTTTTNRLRQFIHSTSHRPRLWSSSTYSVSASARLLSLSTNPAYGQPNVSGWATFRRDFTSSHVSRYALKSSRPSGENTELVASPSEELNDEMELVPLDKAKLQMTRRAAEQLRSIAMKENNPGAALRVRVDSGGCHGYQYVFELAKSRQPDDYSFSHPEVKPSNITVDAVSLGLMKGSVIDFAQELIGSSFRVEDNPQAKGSGCGCGVSWELKEDAL